MQTLKKHHSRFEAARKWLIFWTLFIGVGALFGASGMLLDPTGKAMGMDAMLPYFQVLPFADVLFQNFIFSGIALLIVNGLTNLTAAGLLFARKKGGILLGGLFGITLMLWIVIQFIIFPANFMDTIYFAFGIAQAATGWAAWVFYQQEHLPFCPQDYPKIGSNSKRLVVYFSRMGYVRKAAYEAANEAGAEIYEIKAAERTEGTLGFWWCGRYGMHRWAMPIQEITVDLSLYDHVTICAPIWVFHLAAPVRSFCQQARGKIREADFLLVHHQNSTYQNAAEEMDELLGLVDSPAVSICCRQGAFKHRVLLHGKKVTV